MYSRVWGLEHVLTRIHENTCLYVLGTIWTLSVTLDEYFRHMSYYDTLYNPYCGVALDSRNDSVILYNRLISRIQIRISEHSKRQKNLSFEK